MIKHLLRLLRRAREGSLVKSVDTKGALFVSTLLLAFPIIGVNLLRMMFGIIDTIVAGSLDVSALAVVSIGTSIFWFILVPASATLDGFKVLAIRFAGAGDISKMISVLTNSLLVALMLSVCVSLAFPILYWCYSLTGLDALVLQDVKIYLMSVLPAAFFLLIFIPLEQYWHAKGHVLPLTIIVTIMQPVNYFLNLYLATDFLGGAELGVLGIGISTSICKALEFALCLGYTLWVAPDFRRHFARKININTSFIRNALEIGFPSAGHATSDVFFFSFATFMIAFIGNASVATHQVLFIISCTFWSAFSGWGTATSIKIGHAIGAGHLQLATESARWLGAYFVVVCLVTLVITYLSSSPLLGIFSSDLLIIKAAQDIWLLFSVFVFLDLVQSFVVTVLQAFGETRKPFFTHLIVLTLSGSGIVSLLVQNGFGLASVWYTLCVCMVVILLLNGRDLIKTMRVFRRERPLSV